MIEIGKVLSVESFSNRQIVTLLLKEGFETPLIIGAEICVAEKHFELNGWNSWSNGERLDIVVDEEFPSNLIGEVVSYAMPS